MNHAWVTISGAGNVICVANYANMSFGAEKTCTKISNSWSLAENIIRKVLDDGKKDCRVFVDLQKAFNTADHQILLAKFNHYGISGVSNDRFKSYLLNCNQYESINGDDSGVPQESILGQLLFLVYINSLKH